MTLTKQDYQNLLVLLELVPVTGLKQAQMLSVLGVKLESHIATFDAPAPIPLNQE